MKGALPPRSQLIGLSELTWFPSALSFQEFSWFAIDINVIIDNGFMIIAMLLTLLIAIKINQYFSENQGKG